MTWNEFFQSIKSTAPANVYLFSGSEEWIKREAVEALRAKLLPPGLEQLNDTTLEGVSAQQIIDAADTMPMMCERRIVVVRDWAPLLAGKSKNEEAEVERLQKWLDNPPDTCVVVFYMRSEADGRKKAATLLKKKGVEVVFAPLMDAELTKWCAQRLKPQGKKIAASTVSTLAFMAGHELTRLAGELDKLAAYVGDRAEITDDDVRQIVSASLEYNVFEMLNKLLARDLAGAQRMTNSLIQSGQNAVGLLAMLTRQLRQLAHMRYLIDAGEPVQRAQEVLGLKPYGARQVAAQCRGRSAKAFQELYELCVQYDFEIKSGRLRDSAALDAIFLKIASQNLASARN